MADQYLGGLRVTADGALYVSGGYNPASVAITGGTIQLSSGTASAPSYAFAAATNHGMYFTAGVGNAGPTFARGAAVAIFSDQADFRLGSGISLAWGSNASATAALGDLFVARDAADTLAQKRGTNAQTWNHYGSEITAGTRYSRLAIKHATTTLAAVSGATVTATNLIPAKANVLGVNTIVTVALGTGSGTTGYTVGDGSDADRWGVVAGTIAGTDTDGNDATADPTGWFTAASNVVITAAGGNFNGTGSIFVDVAYTLTEAD